MSKGHNRIPLPSQKLVQAAFTGGIDHRRPDVVVLYAADLLVKLHQAAADIGGLTAIDESAPEVLFTFRVRAAIEDARGTVGKVLDEWADRQGITDSEVPGLGRVVDEYAAAWASWTSARSRRAIRLTNEGHEQAVDAYLALAVAARRIQERTGEPPPMHRS